MLYKNKIETNPKHWQHFGCPVYVLDEKLQGGAAIYQKWRQRARVGINLGRSPQHARSVSLVLNIITGLVSPQFHVKLDPAFDTIPQLYEGRRPDTSIWQTKAGFIKTEDKDIPAQKPRQTPKPKEQTPSSTTASEGAQEQNPEEQPAPETDSQPVIPPTEQNLESDPDTVTQTSLDTDRVR